MTDSFAFVVPEIETRVFSEDAFFAQVMQGAAEVLAKEGMQLMLMLAPDRASYERIERFATSGHVDGVIIGSMHGEDPLPSALMRANVPVVVSGRPVWSDEIAYVDVDHRIAVRDAVDFLIKGGRRRIATIAGPQNMIAGVERLGGYSEAVTNAGLEPMVAHGDFTRASGAQAMRDLLDAHEGIDAVFAASDLMADGALRTLRAEGFHVPDDVAVIGFDDSTVAQYAIPALTTIRQPITDMGRALARQVLAMSRGEDVERFVLLPTEFVRRESA